MKYYVDCTALQNGNGQKETPFKLISCAAKIAKPGDEVLVMPGIYREYVDPVSRMRRLFIGVLSRLAQ